MIRRIRHSPGRRRYKPESPYSSGTGVLAWHSRELTIVHNTIWDVDAGIAYASGGSGPRVRITNNIVGGLREATHHVALAEGAARDAQMSHTLFQAPSRIRWGGRTVMNVADLRSGKPGQCGGCLEGEPRWLDARAAVLRPGAGSPALDAGTADPVYEEFEALYGLDIAVDLAKTRRPQGGRWDLGALEVPAGRR
jgi:hypothetical protein